MIDLNRVIEAYDLLSNKIRNDLNQEFLNNRIKGTDYGQAYTQLMSVVLQLSVKVPLEDAQACEIRAKTENTARATAQIDDNVAIELLRTQMTAWAEAFKSGTLEDIPSILKDDEISNLYKSELSRLGSEKWRDQTNQCYNEKTTQGINDE